MPADRDRIVRHIEGGGAWLAPDGQVHTDVATLPSEADFAGTDEAKIAQAREALLARKKALDDELGKLERQSAEAQQAREKAQARQAEQRRQQAQQPEAPQPPARGEGQAVQAEEKGEAAPPFEAQAEGEGDEDARGRRGRRR